VAGRGLQTQQGAGNGPQQTPRCQKGHNQRKQDQYGGDRGIGQGTSVERSQIGFYADVADELAVQTNRPQDNNSARVVRSLFGTGGKVPGGTDAAPGLTRNQLFARVEDVGAHDGGVADQGRQTLIHVGPV